MRNRFLLTALCSLMLAACGQAPGGGEGQPRPPSSRQLMPTDPAIKALYIQSCYGCHSSGAGKAPRSGVAADWDSRWQQGMDLLLHNTKHGIRNMPAKGMCMNCTDEEFIALIRFMAGREEATPAP